MNQERIYWLAWSQIPGINSNVLEKFLEYYTTLQEAWLADLAELKAIARLRSNVVEAIAQTRSQLHPEKFLQEHLRQNPHFWTPADPDYPRLLLETPGIPPVIYYRGEVNPAENQGIVPVMAIVGTRKATEHGCRWARQLSSYLAQYGFTIVGGMAKGIETLAHEACLGVKGRTIAVVATGVDVIYPQQQQLIYQKILSHGGLILSEYPAGSTPDSERFRARNRLIAAISRGVLVIEAPEQSGCLITARHANEFGRDVYVLPNSPEVPQARGCLRLLNQGANLILSAEELLLQLGSVPQLDPLPQSTPDLTPDLAQVFPVVQTEPTSFEAIVTASNLPSGLVAGALLELELLGLVSQLPGMMYKKNAT